MTLVSLFTLKTSNKNAKKKKDDVYIPSSKSPSENSLLNLYTLESVFVDEVGDEVGDGLTQFTNSSSNLNSTFETTLLPPTVHSIERPKRCRQFGSLENVVISMVTKSECDGLEIKKCIIPQRRPETRFYLGPYDRTIFPLPKIAHRVESPGLPASRVSSYVDFSSMEVDSLPFVPEPLQLPKIFGFDQYGREIEENRLPEIQYAYGMNTDEACVHKTRRLESYFDKINKIDPLGEAKIYAEYNLPVNPTKAIEERETAEDFIRSMYKYKRQESDDDNDDVLKSKQKGVFRYRRKITEGSYPNTSVQESELPRLLRYTWKGKLQKLSKYLEEKTSQSKINRHDEQGRTALHFAASWGCVRTMKLLLDVSGIDLNARDEQGKTPLYKAVEIGELEAVKLLVKAGTDINIKALDGRDVFEYALQDLGDSSLDVIKYLYHEGGMKKKRKKNARMTYLHMICFCKRNVKVSKIIEELIRSGEFINATEGSGKTPLILAIQMNRPHIVTLLLENAADPRHVDLNAKSALQYAKPNTECYKEVRTALARIAQRNMRAVEVNIKGGKSDEAWKIVMDRPEFSGKPKKI